MANGDANRDPGVDALKALVDDLDAILWQADPLMGRFTYVSRRAELLLGYPHDAWLAPGFRLDRLVHPDDRERIREVSGREMAAGRDHRIEYRAVAADGRVLWLRDFVRVGRDGAAPRLRGVSVDITEEKLAEEALARQKEYYEGILDHIDIDFAVFDCEGRFEYINPSSIADPDVRRWAIGRTNIEYCLHRGRPVEIGERRHALIEAAVREGKTIEVEEVLSTRDGDSRVILRRHFPVQDEDGRVIRVIGQGYDITDRKAAEEAVRASEERFRLMVEGSEEVFFYEHDTGDRFTYLSPSVKRVLGYEAAELVGRPYTDLLTGDASDGAVAALTDAALRTGDRSPAYNVVLRHRSGAAVILEIVERPVVREGHVVGIQGFARDVTQRRQAEAELRLERERQKALLDAIPDMVWMKDEASRFLAVNEAFACAVGRPKEEVVGKSDRDFFPPRLADQYRRDDVAVLRAGEQRRFEEKVRREDGAEMMVETIKVPFRGIHGEVRGTAGIARDVTDRKQAEAALRASEARFRALIESVSDAIAIVEPDGRFRYLSPAFERITGSRVEDRLGRGMLEEVHPEDAATAERAWRDLLASPDGTTVWEVRIRRRDGEWRRVEVAGKNLIQDPVIAGAVVTYHDVTERRGLEEQLRGVQKMEAVGRLAGGIAHDFNNVLTAIKGHAQFLLEDAPRTGSVREDLGEIIQCTKRAHDLTSQLLAFSRQQVNEPRVIALEAVIRRAERMLRRLIGEDVRLEIEMASDPGHIRADPTQIEQVLVNLAINARDAMPDGGILRVGVGRTVLDARHLPGIPAQIAPGPYARLTVADTGTGMDAQTLEHVFEPFFTTKAIGAGTGLGLATVYGIVKQMHGYIAVASEPGAGTTFEIYLPRTDEDLTRPETRERRSSGGTGDETVLLVEDQTAVRALARRALERAGYRVIEAADGPDALAVWDQARGAIDLLLTDVVMPQMSGKDLALRLRERRPDLRILYMSGYAEEHIAHRGILERGADLLEKPFDPRTLQARVRDALDRPRTTDRDP